MWLHKETTLAYARQITAEQKQVNDKGVETWGFFLFQILDREQQDLMGEGDGIIGSKFCQCLGIADQCHGIVNSGF